MGPKRIIRKLKVLKSRCILNSPPPRSWIPEYASRRDERERRRRGERKARGGEAGRRGTRRLEWYEARRTKRRPKGPKKDGWRERKEREERRGEAERGYRECISAPTAETRDERRSALEDTDTFVREDTKK